MKFAVCVDGQNAAPEDVGGVPGYEEFLGVIADPTHKEHNHHVGWSGGSFDATDFDLTEVNARLQRVR